MSAYTTPSRSIIYGAASVSAVAMTASAATLASLARAVGWSALLQWALPVSVDLLALVAGTVWLSASFPPAVRLLGAKLTVASAGSSVAMNAVAHLVMSGQMAVTAPLVIAVSSVPPLAAVASVHLFAAVRQTAAPAAVSAAPEAAPWRPSWSVRSPWPPPAPAAPVRRPALPSAGKWLSDVELDAVVLALMAETEPPRSYEEMAARFGQLRYVASPMRLHEAWARVTAATEEVR